MVDAEVGADVESPSSELSAQLLLRVIPASGEAADRTDENDVEFGRFLRQGARAEGKCDDSLREVGSTHMFQDRTKTTALVLNFTIRDCEMQNKSLRQRSPARRGIMSPYAVDPTCGNRVQGRWCQG